MDIILEELDYNHNYYDYCALLKQLTSLDINQITYEKFLSQFHKIKSNPFHKIIIAKKNGKIIGTVSILIEPKFIHELSYVAHIEDVVVDSSYRSYGIGKLLINRAIEISKEFACYKITLDCAEKNVEFYKKNGFDRIGIQMALYLK